MKTECRLNKVCYDEYISQREWKDEVMNRLYRSRENRMVAGVCGGLAEYLDADPTMVRLVTVLAILFTGVPALAYLVAWIIIPERP